MQTSSVLVDRLPIYGRHPESPILGDVNDNVVSAEAVT